MSVRLRLSCVTVAALAALAGCGGSNTTPTSDTSASTTATTATTPTTDTTAQTTDTGEQLPKVTLTDGRYVHPDGRYTFRPGSGWDSGDPGDGTILFATNPSDRRDTITISSESLDDAPASLEEYVSFSLESAPQEITGFKLLSRRTITLPSGDRAVRLEFTGTVDDSPLMHFLMLVSTSQSSAVSVSFSSPETRFASVVAKVEPDLLSVDVK